MKRQNTSPNDGLSASMCRTMSRSLVARKLEPRLFHRKRRGRAADQHELIGVAGEVLRKTSSPLTTGSAP